MDLIFLGANTPLTKTYSKNSAGEITKSPYPLVWEFTSTKEQCKNLAHMEQLLTQHALAGRCVLKGTIARPLVNESRAGSTDTNGTTEWIVLDLDGLPDTIDMVTGSRTNNTALTIDLFLAEMGLQDISYIVQWSASYGIENKKLRAHVFMLLDKPYAAPLIKQWLMQKNHEIPLLRDSMSLTKTGNSLSWALDVSACQNDKLIYIAPPTLRNIKDPMGKMPRISLVKRKHDKLALSSSTINSSSKNKELTHRRIKELREEAGLPERKISYKMHGSTEIMLKPDECIITEMKTERGFVYFNLNGGDSWAYYHPENAPDYILNFKGEPAYLTKELLPDYWQQLTGTGSSTRTSSSGITYLAFLDRTTGVYWRGTYEASTDLLDINPAKNETQLRHFAKQYGVPMGDFVPEWDLTFDPQGMQRVDTTNRVVNKFQPSQYMLRQGKPPKSIPKTIMKVLDHALGSDKATTDHFINWLATILQTRDRTRTAWVLHGTQGTGKGILTSEILRPIFGTHAASRRMEELGERYNHFMENSFVVFVDEVQTKALGNSERGVMAKLKNFITEAMVPIRAMYANATEVRNYTNWIFMSNMPDPVSIDKEDRRMNVGKYQPNKLAITSKEVEGIEKELQAFYNFLMAYPADYDLAGTVLQSVDRDTMISISESSTDTVSSALLEGSFEFFIEQLPTDNNHVRNAQANNRVVDYTDLLKALMARTQPSGDCTIGREELRTLFDFTCGSMPTTPNKFTALLKHHRIHMGVVWVDNKSVRGIRVNWKDANKFAAYTKMHMTAAPALAPAPKAPPKAPAKKVAAKKTATV